MATAETNITLNLSSTEAGVIQALLCNVFTSHGQYAADGLAVSEALESVGITIDDEGSVASELASMISEQLGDDGITLGDDIDE